MLPLPTAMITPILSFSHKRFKTETMIITLNGKTKTYDQSASIAALLQHEGYAGMTIAVARNGTFIPKTTYESTMIEDGDEIDIVAPMQGG